VQPDGAPVSAAGAAPTIGIGGHTPWPLPLDEDTRALGWQDAWRTLGADAPAGLRERLEAAWSEPGRHYHDTRHLGECLALLQAWRSAAERPAEVALALWFHDAVYDPHARDSEARSAAWAGAALAEADDAARRVAALVLATRHDDAPSDGAGDTALLQDIDLAVLGSPPDRFDAYDRDVRLEYGHLPDAAWRAGRAAVLRAFLGRPRLYRTAAAAAQLEAQARANLRRALDRLEAA